MNWNHELFSDLTLILPPLSKSFIKVNGTLSTCILSTNVESSPQYSIQSCIDSSEYVEEVQSYNDLNFEFTKIDGITYEVITFAIPSLYFKAPNFLLIDNKSMSDVLKISIRGNR